MNHLPVTRRWMLSAALLVALWPSNVRGSDITGLVLEEGTLNPIGEALVTLQATAVRTVTAADGSFTLTVEGGTDLVIVGAKKFYYNASITVDPPVGGVEILLEPVPQDDDPEFHLFEPEFCGSCHHHNYNKWLDTPMAMAGVNTWVHDMYSGQGTPGGMGGFVYLRDSVYADSNPNSECASCHQPERWIANPFSALEDPTEPPSPEVVHGISCEVCHKIADVNVANINFPGLFPGAVTFTRPAGPGFYPVQYGVLGDVDWVDPTTMRASYQPQLVAEACGTCHQDANDPDQNHTFNGVISEPTYGEWATTPYAYPDSPYYASCVTCHMPPAGVNVVCDVMYPPLPRDPETIRSHIIVGTTPEYLENAVEMTMQVQHEDDVLNVEVAIVNSLTGHHVPTGVTVRNMILLVESWREGDDPLLSPLDHLGSQTVHDLGGVGDPTQGYYAGLPGKFYAKVLHDAEGNSPTFFTEATGIVFDNRIAAFAADVTSYSFAVPEEGGLLHVRARLIYRRAFRFLVDAKQWTMDGHGNPLEDVLPPDFGHLMESAEQAVPLADGDFDGDSDVDLDDYAYFHECLGGPDAPPDPNGPLTVHDCLNAFDFDGNSRVDLQDFATIQNLR